eukprot:CAMPEP_0170120450 /NCGR_PEP_ID=MMETSP0020_2-20130122/15153_1 /TAXON_ID=98059 /ORGANISM="Dinobryon sp., Strain UTEXLB2267" /LENGTH=110 /DNA_ID=CAMNT_0010350323 /DNA_START=285 /DNA_END=614 /DNA_ORIENTATION=+
MKRSHDVNDSANKDVKRRKEGHELIFHLIPIATSGVETLLPTLQKPCLRVPLSFKVSTVQKFIYKRLEESVQSTMKEQHQDIEILYNDAVMDPTGTLSSLPENISESSVP